MTGDHGETEHDRCGGNGRGSGKPCRLPAGWGTSHPGWGRCRKHFGNSPNHIVAAQEQQAQQACDVLGVPVHGSAREALTEALAVARGRAVFFRAKEAALSDKELTEGVRRMTAKPGRGGGQPVREVVHETGVSVWTRLLQDAEDRLAGIATAMARIGIEERHAVVAEQQAAYLKRILDAVFADPRLALSPEQMRALPTVVSQQVRALSAVPDAR